MLGQTISASASATTSATRNRRCISRSCTTDLGDDALFGGLDLGGASTQITFGNDKW